MAIEFLGWRKYKNMLLFLVIALPFLALWLTCQPFVYIDKLFRKYSDDLVEWYEKKV